jgi:hypothetical protein
VLVEMVLRQPLEQMVVILFFQPLPLLEVVVVRVQILVMVGLAVLVVVVVILVLVVLELLVKETMVETDKKLMELQDLVVAEVALVQSDQTVVVIHLEMAEMDHLLRLVVLP